MKKQIIEWWNRERVGRAEEGTSQDICPTNGGAVIWFLVNVLAWSPVVLYFIFRRTP